MTSYAGQRLDIDALRTIRAIWQHRGVTRAAEALGLSQSAVSHKIKRLEASLDCPLLDREPGKALFTPAGDALLGYADRILDLHDEALLNLTKSTLTGRIQLGLTEETTCTDLARILGRFARLHPQVAVRTRVRMSLVLREMLEAEALDVAILQLFAHEARPSDVILHRETLHWVKSPALHLPPGETMPYLSFQGQCFYRQWAMDIGQDGGAQLEPVFECASATGIAAAVSAGLGVALLNGRHLRPGMESSAACCRPRRTWSTPCDAPARGGTRRLKLLLPRSKNKSGWMEDWPSRDRLWRPSVRFVPQCRRPSMRCPAAAAAADHSLYPREVRSCLRGRRIVASRWWSESRELLSTCEL